MDGRADPPLVSLLVELHGCGWLSLISPTYIGLLDRDFLFPNQNFGGFYRNLLTSLERLES